MEKEFLNAVKDVMEKNKGLITETTHNAQKEYFELIDKGVSHENANFKVQEYLIETIFSSKWLEMWDKLMVEFGTDRNSFQALKHKIKDIFPLEIPPSDFSPLPSGLRMSIIAALGTILGMKLLSFRHILPECGVSVPWEPGLFIGAALGAFAFTWLSMRLFTAKIHIPLLSKEVNWFKNLFSSHRFHPEHKRIVKDYITTWLRCVCILVSFALFQQKAHPRKEALPSKIVEKILSLKDLSKDKLPVAIDELIQALQIEGFEMEDISNTFIWSEEHRNQFDTYGAVFPGDKVIVKYKPIFKNGTIVRKGLVMKVRGK